jgi:hypothetical protein
MSMSPTVRSLLVRPQRPRSWPTPGLVVGSQSILMKIYRRSASHQRLLVSTAYRRLAKCGAI